MEPGFLFINKPTGMTSFSCIRHIKKLLPKGTKIGHAGTLDPHASGLLIIAIKREATREISRFSKLDKEYIATGKLGMLTDSLDLEGEVVQEDTVPVNAQQLEDAIAQLGSHYTQIPPIYSALQFEGRRLYELARKKKMNISSIEKIAEQKARTVKLIALELLDFDFPHFTIKARVSHGTYIRSLVNDIAKLAGSCATTVKLERTRIGDHSTTDALPIDAITSQTLPNTIRNIHDL